MHARTVHLAAIGVLTALTAWMAGDVRALKAQVPALRQELEAAHAAGAVLDGTLESCRVRSGTPPADPGRAGLEGPAALAHLWPGLG